MGNLTSRLTGEQIIKDSTINKLIGGVLLGIVILYLALFSYLMITGWVS